MFSLFLSTEQMVAFSIVLLVTYIVVTIYNKKEKSENQ